MKNTITNMGFMVRPTCAGQLASDFTTTDSFSTDSLPQMISIKNQRTDTTIKANYEWNEGNNLSCDSFKSATYFEDNNIKNLIPLTVSNISSKETYKLPGAFSSVNNLNIRLVKIFGVCNKSIEKNVVASLSPSIPIFLYSKTSVSKIVLKVLFKKTMQISVK